MRTPQVDWSDWSFGPGRHPVQGSVQAGLAALSLTMVGHATGLIPPMWPLAAGVLLGLAAAVTAAWRGMPGQAVAFRAACCVAAGVWSTCTLMWSDPWARWPLVLLATGVAVAAVIGSGLAWAEKRAAKPATPEPEPMPTGDRDPLAAEWEDRLRRITRRTVTVVKVDRWDPPTGHTLHVLLPDDGTTVADLKGFEAPLAAGLPVGCNVEVMPPGRGSKRLCRVRVSTVNAMATPRHVEDVTPLTIALPLPIGDYADRSQATIHLRYSCCVLVGQVDSGKSNTLNVITHRVAQCTDAIVWAIDVSGQGRFPAPWVRAWVEGHAPVPVIDWPAATVDEARLLTAAAINVINGRSAAYRQMMFEANEDKIPVSPQLPEIVILVDEFADLPHDIKDALETISNTGRGAAVRVVSCVLRAIGTDISRDMVVQARERIAMRMADESEAQYLFDSTWRRGRFDPDAMPYQGSGLLMTDGGAPLPFRARRLDPQRIHAASAELALLRPQLDGVSVQLADTVVRQVQGSRGGWVAEQVTGAYAQRWERMLPVMFPAAPALAGEATAPAAPPPAPVGAGGTTTKLEDRVNLDESAAGLERAVEAARRAREAAEAEQEIEEADFAVVEGWLGESPAASRPPAKVRIRQVVEGNRRDGIGPRAVWQTLQQEGYQTAEQTVITWMRADADAGVLAQPGGRGSPYIPGPHFTTEQS